MKTTKSLLAMLLSFAFLASCSNNNSPEVPDGNIAKLQIAFGNKVVEQGQKSFAANDAGVVIRDANVFVMNANDKILSKIYISGTDVNSTTKEYSVHNTAKYLIVISNTGDLVSSGKSLADVVDLSVLKSKLATFESINPAQILMSGTSATLVFNQKTADGKYDLAVGTVTVKMLPARLDVKVINNMTNYTDADAVVIEGVSVLYSGGYSHYLAATTNGTDFFIPVSETPASQKFFRSGFTSWGAEATTQNEAYAATLDQTWNGDTATPYENTFYVFPTNNPTVESLARPVIATVRGTFNGADHYFSVLFNGTEAVKVESGQKYNVTITLSGEATTGGGGEPDPEIPSSPLFIKVQVTPTPWEAVTVSKEFK